MIYKLFNRIAGSIAGFFTGLAAGAVMSAKDTVLNEGLNALSALVFLGSLPFYMTSHAMQGCYAGATQGFEAGTSYLQTVLNKKYARKMAESLSSLQFAKLLTDEELQAYQKHLDSMPENGKQLRLELDKYKYCINQKANGMELYKYNKPIVLTYTNGQKEVSEFETFKAHVDECAKSGSTINHSRVSSVYGVGIFNFINKVRNMLDGIMSKLTNSTSTASLIDTLGSSKDNISPPQKKVIITTEPSAPQPQAMQPGLGLNR